MIALAACSSCSVVLVIAVIGVGLTVKIEREAQRECSMKKAVLGIAVALAASFAVAAHTMVACALLETYML